MPRPRRVGALSVGLPVKKGARRRGAVEQLRAHRVRSAGGGGLSSMVIAHRRPPWVEYDFGTGMGRVVCEVPR